MTQRSGNRTHCPCLVVRGDDDGRGVGGGAMVGEVFYFILFYLFMDCDAKRVMKFALPGCHYCIDLCGCRTQLVVTVQRLACSSPSGGTKRSDLQKGLHLCHLAY